MKLKATPRAIHGQNVISMFGYKAENNFPAIKEVEAYWEGLRMGRLVPMRSEVDPRGIERALEYTFILERIAPGLARFRLNGMHLNDLLGMEVRGMPFTSFFTPKARQAVTQTLEAVFDDPQIAEMTLKGERSIGKPALDAKLILLPLRSDLGEITRIMGCLVSSGPIGRAPRRFDVADTKMKALKGGAHAPDFAPKPSTDVPASGFAESQIPFVSAPTITKPAITKPDTSKPAQNKRTSPQDSPQKGPSDKRPALRLVKSDD